MRIFITGAAGMLGQAICRHFSGQHELIAPPRAALDITDRVALQRQLQAARPDWVFHLAALTDVDACQRQPERAYRVNGAATVFLAGCCRQLDIPLLFLSSIAVFSGQKATPYSESDQPQPANVYGASKWQGEQAVAALPQHLIVRSGWLFGGGPVDKKFVRRILLLARQQPVLPVVADKIGSPTCVCDLSSAIARLLEEGRRGLVHLVNDGPPVSRFELARAIVRLAGLATEIRPVSSAYFPQLAPRPDMEAAASEICAGWLRPWDQALAHYLADGGG